MLSTRRKPKSSELDTQFQCKHASYHYESHWLHLQLNPCNRFPLFLDHFNLPHTELQNLQRTRTTISSSSKWDSGCHCKRQVAVKRSQYSWVRQPDDAGSEWTVRPHVHCHVELTGPSLVWCCTLVSELGQCLSRLTKF